MEFEQPKVVNYHNRESRVWGGRRDVNIRVMRRDIRGRFGSSAVLVT